MLALVEALKALREDVQSGLKAQKGELDAAIKVQQRGVTMMYDNIGLQRTELNAVTEEQAKRIEKLEASTAETPAEVRSLQERVEELAAQVQKLEAEAQSKPVVAKNSFDQFLTGGGGGGLRDKDKEELDSRLAALEEENLPAGLSMLTTRVRELEDKMEGMESELQLLQASEKHVEEELRAVRVGARRQTDTEHDRPDSGQALRRRAATEGAEYLERPSSGGSSSGYRPKGSPAVNGDGELANGDLQKIAEDVGRRADAALAALDEKVMALYRMVRAALPSPEETAAARRAARPKSCKSWIERAPLGPQMRLVGNSPASDAYSFLAQNFEHLSARPVAVAPGKQPEQEPEASDTTEIGSLSASPKGQLGAGTGRKLVAMPLLDLSRDSPSPMGSKESPSLPPADPQGTSGPSLAAAGATDDFRSKPNNSWPRPKSFMRAPGRPGTARGVRPMGHLEKGH